jgi:predicted DNA-binding transcriptional regulator AlpA
MESAMDESFTIDEFCASEKISRSFFYKLETQGNAPKTYPLGRTRRISGAAYVAWRTARESVAA